MAPTLVLLIAVGVGDAPAAAPSASGAVQFNERMEAELLILKGSALRD
jgi:hypothetical protein